jgi:hypothetical protein
MPQILVPQQLAMQGLQDRKLLAEELGNFLRDLVFLHDRLWILASKEFVHYNYQTTWFFGRNTRPLPVEARLEVVSFRKESPWFLLLDLGAFGAFGAVCLLYLKVLRIALLLPGEFVEQRLRIEILEHTRAEKRKRESSTIIEPTQQDISQLPGLRGEQGEKNYQLLLRDAKRLSNGPLKTQGIEIAKSAVIDVPEE